MANLPTGNQGQSIPGTNINTGTQTATNVKVIDKSCCDEHHEHHEDHEKDHDHGKPHDEKKCCKAEKWEIKAKAVELALECACKCGGHKKKDRCHEGCDIKDVLCDARLIYDFLRD
jgi:hypothetical protein